MKPSRPRCLRFLTCALLVVLMGCSPSKQAASELPSTSKEVASVYDAESRTYKNGPWWTAPDITERFHLSFQHILISHENADLDYWYGLWPWLDERPARSRHRSQAEELVDSLAERLRADPSLFAATARQHSDDLVTSSFGGRFGVIRASNVPLELIDAYAALAEGEVSRPFRTIAGLHIIARTPVPPDPRLWSAQIVIAHQGSLRWGRPDRKVDRTKEQARELAREVAHLAQRDPTRFAELARVHSDEYSGLVGGDLGSHPYHEGSSNVALRETTLSLGLGAVSDPIPDASGFVIIKRLEPRELERRAFSQVLLSFAEATFLPEALRSPRTQVESGALANTLARRLARHPEQFEAAQLSQCVQPLCKAGETIVTDGRIYPLHHRALANLSIGEVSAQPEWTPVGYSVFKRVGIPATDGPAQALNFEVP